MPLDDVIRVKDRIVQITHLKIRLKMVFAKDDLAGIVMRFTGAGLPRLSKKRPLNRCILDRC